MIRRPYFLCLNGRSQVKGPKKMKSEWHSGEISSKGNWISAMAFPDRDSQPKDMGKPRNNPTQCLRDGLNIKKNIHALLGL